jgi:hypothetical protein
MKYVFFCLFIVFALPTIAQNNTQAKGTFFVSGGIGKAVFAGSDLQLSSAAQNRTISNIKATDNFSLPQWNGRFGYYVKNQLAIGLGIHNVQYNYSDSDPLQLNGTLKNNIQFAHVDLQWNDKLFKTRSSNFAITYLLGLHIGPTISKVSMNQSSNNVVSASYLSGFAFAGSVGLRAEFYKRVFISLEQLGGVIAQNNRNFSNDFLKEMKQNIGFGQTNVSLGFFLFYKSSDECNTCPKW